MVLTCSRRLLSTCRRRNGPDWVFMTTIKGYCHKICDECVIYQATQADDDNRRMAIAQTLSEIFDKNIRPEDINCDGCLPDSKRLFKNCRDCSIRNRALIGEKSAEPHGRNKSNQT